METTTNILGLTREQTLAAFQRVSLKGRKTMQVREYKLRYYWGGWHTHATFCCEADTEAIHDADEEFLNNRNMRGWCYGVALFCGNRKVKTYKA